MARTPADEPVDERLRKLLAIEQRLQERIRKAEADATRRIAEARTDGERVRADAERLLALADEEQASADGAAQARALTSIQHEHDEALRAITGVSEERVDELAGRALDRAIGGSGGST